jgi:HprK-related kinase A
VWLILHAAVLERGGCALVMPGSPGKGKSTLAAALMLRGWRLLSDEFALLSPGDLCLTPVPRPVSLKNESIEAIRRFAPESVIGQASYDTAKGTVAHLRPTPESVMKSAQVARPRWIVFPRFVAGAAGELSPRSKARTLLEAAQNGFNYAILAETAFDALAAALDDCECYDFCYGDLEEAVDVFGRLAAAA